MKEAIELLQAQIDRERQYMTLRAESIRARREEIRENMERDTLSEESIRVLQLAIEKLQVNG